MALFVHVTQRCEEEAASAGWQEDLEKLKNKVERAQDLQGFDHFPAPYRVKKKFPRYNARVIASMHAVGEHDVACFLSILTKADSEYDQFQHDPVGYGRRNFDGLVSAADLQRIVAERTAETPPTPKPQPTEAEYTFLFRADGGVELGKSDDGLICESPAWVKKVAETPVKDRLTDFHRALGAIPPGTDFVELSNRPGWGIFYAHHPELHTTVLLEALTGDARERLPELRQKYSALLAGNGDITQEVLLRHCQRAYPDYLRFGEDEWLEVQKDAVANIALSPEETRVLEAARQARGAFPLFINGRAGSGKSTLLQYIFAEHLHRYIQLEQEAGFKPPLYLTCSGDLLKHSQEVVGKLLKCNASFLSAGEPVRIDHNHRATMEQSFQEFRPFLLTHLKAENRSRFSPTRRVDFAQFRKLWQKKFGSDVHARKRFGPDISWHVIRTYIKGMSAESYQDPDDYRQFDTKERLVTNDAFDEVFKKVWDNWYRPMCEDSGYWDDQDLARLLIQHDLVKAERPAIFCDEAQDFTRLELELILRLCLFSGRAVAPQEISCIPLVFAGDPFQTLNPTGFRWEATKAAFVEKFVLSLDPNRRSGMDDLNYRELTYNYRSSRNIVLFSNLTQALRCHLFDLRQVNPQEPWAAEPSSPPVVWFDVGDGAFWERLRKERGVTIIVPCGEGEEPEFVQQHLKNWIRLDDKGVPLEVNVFSAGRAKGLEFDRVVVFGFGDHIQEDVLAPLRGNTADRSADQSLPLEYFINRLYVAVSRPKRRLFVVDSVAGRKRLWEFATNQQLEEALLRQLRDGSKWEGKVGGMVDGTPAHLDTDEAPNLEEEAKNIEAQGLNLGDAYLLRSAANRYRLAGVPAKAAYCTAEALYVEDKFAEAGRAFLESGYPSRAVDAFWRDGRPSDKALVEAAAAKPELRARLEVRFATFLVAPNKFNDGLSILSKLAERLSSPEEAVALASCNYWTDPARRVAEKMVEVGEKQQEAPDWNVFSATITKLEAGGFGFKQSLKARVCYLAGDWANAVAFWESANEKNSKEYREAKARVAPYPECLAHLKELGRNDAILEAYSANQQVPLDAEGKRIVGTALVAAKCFDEALDLFVAVGAISEIGELAAAAHASAERAVVEKAIRLTAILLVQQSQWVAVREYLSNHVFPKVSKETQKALASVMEEYNLQFERLLAASFARSDSLTKLDSAEQKPISRFLRDFEKSKFWQTRISAKELGAAIERSQRFVDAVEFYESLLSSAQTDEENRFAIVRWVKSKARLETFYRGERQFRRADEIKKEIAKVQTTHQIQPDELAVEYPELDTLNELLQRELTGFGKAESPKPATKKADEEPAKQSPAPTPPVEATAECQPLVPKRPDAEILVGQLKLKLSRENKRINLEHQTTSKTATIRLSPVSCTSEDVVWTPDDAANKVHKCEEWGLEVNLSDLESLREVVLRFPISGITVRLSDI